MNVAPAIWYQIFDRDRGCCRYCGADLLLTFAAYCSATMDHIVGVAVGGSDEPSNLVLACSGCNGALSRSSHLRTFEERKTHADAQRQKGWARYVQLLEQHRRS